MKSYNQFLEATEGDLRKMGASPAQIAMLKKRQAARGKGFSTGDDRVKTGTPAPATPRKALPTGRSSGGVVKRAAGNVARRAANKGAAIVRQKAANKLKAMRAGTDQSRRAADSSRMQPGGLVRGKNYQEPAKKKRTTERQAVNQVKRANPDQRQAGKGPDRAYGGGPYPKVQQPGKKTNNPQSVAMKRKRQEYLEKQKQAKKDNENKGGFMGGVKKALGGDLIQKDKDKRRKARFERGKAMADGIKSKIGSLGKIRLKPPSTDTGYSPSEDLKGPKKFGRSAS